MPTLESDAMYNRLRQMLDGTECSRCGKHPDLLWAWDGIKKATIIEQSAVAAGQFAEQALGRLKADGWQMIGEAICCADCAAPAPNSH